MNCDLFEAVLMDLVRGSVLDERTRNRAMNHAKACSLCRTRLANEQALSLGLRALALADGRERAPDFVEATLRAAFLTQNQKPTRRRYLLGWAIGAAASVLLAFTVWYWRAGRIKPSEGASERALAPAQAPGLGVAADVESRPNEAPVSIPAARRAKLRAKLRVQKPVELATGFLSLPYADSQLPLGDETIVRVELPDSALRVLGVERGYPSTQPIIADVILGEDGLAREIRLVGNAGSEQLPSEPD